MLRLSFFDERYWRCELQRPPTYNEGSTPAKAAALQMKQLRQVADAIEAALPELEQLDLLSGGS